MAPKLIPGATTTDLSAQVAMMRAGTPWGRVKAAARYFISGVLPDTWMSPQQPVDPVAQEAWGRNKDYPVGFNLLYTPRAGELTSFQQLRALSENCDLVRIAIETRKDQMGALKWSIGHTDPKKDKAQASDTRVLAIESLFRCPDRIHDWDQWLRMVLEDVLVIDAPAILPRRLNSGVVFGFEVIDGATIKPLVDDAGRRPLPPSPAYQQNLKGLPAVDYTADELVYRPRNPRSYKFYGYSPVEQIMLTVNIAIRRALSQLQYYTEGNIPAAFVNVPANWTPQQIEQFQAYWDTVIEGQQAMKRKVRFVPEGTKPASLSEPPLKDDFDEWLARVVTYAFSLPPTAFVKQMNRSTSETQQDAAEDEGLAPLKQWVKRLMDHLIRTYLNAPDLEFVWVEEETSDPKDQADVLTTYQKGGVYSINEIREKLGEDPIADEAGDARFIITGSGATPLAMALNPPQPMPNADEGDDPGKPTPKGGKSKGTAADRKASVAKGAHSHLHKAAPITPAGAKLQDTLATALEVVRDSAVAKASALSKASNTDDRGSEPASDYREYWGEFAASLDTSGLSLAWDDLSETLEVQAADGARHAVARIVEEHPEEEAAARGAGFDMLDHQDPNAVAWAQKRSGELIASDGNGGMLADSTREMVRQTIADAMDSHATNDELAAILHDDYAFSEERAETIARTEVTNALGNGALAGARAVGMLSKRWLVSNDENKCARCIANAEQGWIPIDDAYVSGAEAPGQHPNCQCDQAFRRQPAED